MLQNNQACFAIFCTKNTHTQSPPSRVGPPWTYPPTPPTLSPQGCRCAELPPPHPKIHECMRALYSTPEMNEVQGKGSAKDAENTLCSKIDLRFGLNPRNPPTPSLKRSLLLLTR